MIESQHYLHDNCYTSNSKQVAQGTWKALNSANCFIKGDFTFASGRHATFKVDAEQLYQHPLELNIILQYFSEFKCIASADALVYVPNGMNKFVELLGKQLNKPVINIKRRPDYETKYDFEFTTPDDKELASAANQIVICEDVVTTLGSVAAVRALFPPSADVHSVAILRRDDVNIDYQNNLVDHYLLELKIPTDSQEFSRLTASGWPKF